MSTDREVVIPAAPVEPLEVQMAQLRRWIEGYVDPDGKRHAGLIEMVGELYDELKAKRERREAYIRAFTTGGVLSLIGVGLAWLKEHIK